MSYASFAAFCFGMHDSASLRLQSPLKLSVGFGSIPGSGEKYLEPLSASLALLATSAKSNDRLNHSSDL